jgi:hypothetical protein
LIGGLVDGRGERLQGIHDLLKRTSRNKLKILRYISEEGRLGAKLLKVNLEKLNRKLSLCRQE